MYNFVNQIISQRQKKLQNILKGRQCKNNNQKKTTSEDTTSIKIRLY